jgi:hypothetical protein
MDYVGVNSKTFKQRASGTWPAMRVERFGWANHRNEKPVVKLLYRLRGRPGNVAERLLAVDRDVFW